MSVQSIMDIESCIAAEEEPRSGCKGGMYRRVIFSVTGLAAFVAGAFVLTRHGDAETSNFARRRLMDDGSSDGVAATKVDLVKQFIEENMPKAETRRLETSTVTIGFTDTDMFYIVNVMNYLGEYVCAMTKKKNCKYLDDDVLPSYVRAADVRNLLTGLRDSDDGIKELGRFDSTALSLAYRLIDTGVGVAQKELNRLKSLYETEYAMDAIQITGNIAAAVLSVTPFVFIGAFTSMAVTAAGELVEGFVTSDQIMDTKDSIATKILDMGKYVAEAPALNYLKHFQDAENQITMTWSKLVVNGPLKVVQGSDQMALRRFLGGLARATSSVGEMEDLLIQVHNQFKSAPMEGFTLWRDVAQSMVEIDEKMVNVKVFSKRIDLLGINDEVFDGFASILLAGGIVTSQKAAKWAKATVTYKGKDVQAHNRKLIKLRNMSGDPVPVRRATLYSRATAGLSVAGAVIQGIGLGFKIAQRDTLVAQIEGNIRDQKANLRQYYKNLHDNIVIMIAEDKNAEKKTENNA